MSRWTRRAFLGGAGAVVALPWLPSLHRGARAEGAPPRRLVWWYAPNGMPMAAWTPEGDGQAMALSPVLQPLDGLVGELSVVSGLSNAGIELDGILRPPHAAAVSGWLTGAPVQAGTTRAGRSVDQVAARSIGLSTPLRSLQLGTEGAERLGNCDVGYPCTYQQTVSWADSGAPLPQLTDPRVLFERLFAGTRDDATRAERARRLRWRASVLDGVLGQVEALELRLGTEDRGRLDGYLTSVRELELRLERLADAPACDPGREAPGPPVDLEEHVELMAELTALALACDLTRVVTFMLANGQSDTSYAFLGVEGGHHAISHHGGDPDKLADLAVIGSWQVERFAAFLSRLRDTPEGDGSLLDQCAVVFGSGVSDGDTHSLDDLPHVVAGRLGGALRPSGHVRTRGRPLPDLHLTLLEAAGAGTGAFAGSTTPIDDLLA